MMRRLARQCLVNGCALLLVLAACIVEGLCRFAVLLTAGLCNSRRRPSL